MPDRLGPPDGRQLVVAVDATPLLGNPTGIGMWTRGLLESLPRTRVRPLAFAITARGRGMLGSRVPGGVATVRRPMPARPLHWLWCRFPGPKIEWWTGRIDVVHGTNFVVPPAASAASVVTVHDLTAWRYPQLVTDASRVYPKLVARAVARGAWIHTNSAFVAGEVRSELGVDPDRVVVAAPGIPPVRAEARDSAGEGRYVLALGTVEPRKDLPSLVRAFDAVAGSLRDVRLVIAGADGWGAQALTEAIAASPFRDRIVRLGYVDDTRRAELLHGATVLAYPSVYEGFGFPPLEAMGSGVPVVATEAGSLPEVLGDAAVMVDVGDSDALAAALQDVLSDDGKRGELVRRGYERVAAYDWGRFGSAMADIYARCAGVSPLSRAEP